MGSPSATGNVTALFVSLTVSDLQQACWVPLALYKLVVNCMPPADRLLKSRWPRFRHAWTHTCYAALACRLACQAASVLHVVLSCLLAEMVHACKQV
jgi:hypothetical protein